ncbi:MAG: hypothetical protein LBC99_05590 [Spirochaetota bacterium]|nr:hypothetical protein [Spirochaetota bacterium]
MKISSVGFDIKKTGDVYKLTGNNCPDDLEVIVRQDGIGMTNITLANGRLVSSPLCQNNSFR